MGYSIWSWQCRKCYGTHADIVIKKEKPSANLVRCPFCGERMRVYELGKGFRAKPQTLRIKIAA